MKNVLIISILLTSFLSFSQKTIQFSDPQPTGNPSVVSVSARFFGKYTNPNNLTSYIIDENGISIQSVVVSSITRTQLRESAKLRVSGDYLHGIVENDSIPCVLEGENYYYALPQKLVVVGKGSLNMLTKIKENEYILNFHEGMYFEPSILRFTENKMEIVHGELSYVEPFNTILNVNTITRYGSEVQILAPTFEQWGKLSSLLFKGEVLIYEKQKS